MATILATVFCERGLWVATFERTDEDGFAVARHIFGKEPTDPEIHAFVQEHYASLSFGSPTEIELVIKRKNPKRMRREARKEMVRSEVTPSTHAQDYMREELEKHKKEKRAKKSQLQRARKEERFAEKQHKRKVKKKGR